MTTDNTYGIAADRLLSFVERIERLEDEKRELQASIKPELKGLADEIKDVFDEAKAAGFDVGALRVILAERRPSRRAAQETVDLVDLYRRALGQLAGTPLGTAAVERVAADEQANVPDPRVVAEIRKMQRSAKKGGYGLSVKVGDREPVVIADPPAH